MPSMKISTLHTPSTPRTRRRFGQLVLTLLFVLSVFQLTHLSAAANHGFVDLWRGLAVGSLFLFFYLPSAGRTRSDR